MTRATRGSGAECAARTSASMYGTSPEQIWRGSASPTSTSSTYSLSASSCLYALITLPTRASMSCSTPSGASGAWWAIARTATRAAGARAERRAAARKGAAAAREFTARKAKAIVGVGGVCRDKCLVTVSFG